MPTPPKHVVLSKKQIGQRLRELRKERGLSQVELARAIGTHQTNISEIERGVRGLTLQQLVKFSRALNILPDDVLGEAKLRDARQPRNARLLRRLQRIEELPPGDQRSVLKFLEALLARHQLKKSTSNNGGHARQGTH